MNQIIPPPRNTRQTLLAFAFHDRERGLASVLNRIDTAPMTRRQIYFAVLGRPPERPANALDGANFNPRQAISSALNGEEFQAKIREIVLGAFPEKRRLIFVHIPKCAGSDLLVTLQARFPYLHHHLALTGVTNKSDLFAGLQALVGGLALSDSIAISGHVPLRWYLERNLVRFEDELFTTVRHPRDIIYSYISFLLTRIAGDPHAKRNDVRQWLAHIGMTSTDAEPSRATLVKIGAQLLRARPVTGHNIICTNLGTGNAASAKDAMVLTDIEITDTARYSAWRSDRFGFAPKNRVNVSEPYFTPETASKADRSFIDDIIAEDMIVYEAIQAKLQGSDALSVRGRVFG